MIKLVVGSRGSGKTKKLIDMVHFAAANSKGNVVCIEQGDSLKFDLNHKIRLIDIEKYNISGSDAYFGFIAGVLAGNYDITELFCDATYRIICGPDCKDPAILEDFMKRICSLSEKNDVEIVFTVSADQDEIPASLHEFILA